jgi:hypothetical protein
MACMTLFAQPRAMATTQFTSAIRCEAADLQHFGSSTANTPLRMNWVVVTDNHGGRQLRMQWTSSGENC